MRNIVIVLVIVALGIMGLVIFTRSQAGSVTKVVKNPKSEKTVSKNQDQDKVEVIAEGLDTPWGMVFLSDNTILVTERGGSVRAIKDNKLGEAIKIKNTKEIGEGGLLGITIDPDFQSNKFVYLYYTYSVREGDTLNRVSRFQYQNNKLENEKIVVDKIPGASNHNGGRIKFGPDKLLYIATGDAQEPSKSQDKNSLAGKILRIKDEKVEVYSYGHRNVQGLAWDQNGQLWATEHGPSGGQYGIGHDEFNKILESKNYGWPVIIGDASKIGMEQPVSHSGDDTWAPAGAAFYEYSEKEYSIFFAGLRGQSLYEMRFNNENTTLRTHFKGEFGRIRDVVLGPDNLLYITTSNKDGRGLPKSGDDKVIKINPLKL